MHAKQKNERFFLLSFFFPFEFFFSFPFEVGSRCYRVVQHESHKSLSVVLDEKSELKSVLETEVLEKVMETYQRVQKKFLGGNMV